MELVDGVYWYEVAFSDTLSGVCLHFDTTEAKVRAVNFLGSGRNLAGVKVLRIPRSVTGRPEHDYSNVGGMSAAAAAMGRLPEEPEVKRKRQLQFKVHMMVLLSAQRSLKEEDCFTKTEALAYVVVAVVVFVVVVVVVVVVAVAYRRCLLCLSSAQASLATTIVQYDSHAGTKIKKNPKKQQN